MVKYNGNIADITLMIKHIMLDMDIKQKDLCNATGWTKATISNLLNNRTENPSLKILLELCNAMNCDLNIDIVPRAKEDSQIGKSKANIRQNMTLRTMKQYSVKYPIKIYREVEKAMSDTGMNRNRWTTTAIVEKLERDGYIHGKKD